MKYKYKGAKKIFKKKQQYKVLKSMYEKNKWDFRKKNRN